MPSQNHIQDQPKRYFLAEKEYQYAIIGQKRVYIGGITKRFSYGALILSKSW